jgi:integrase
MLVAAGAALPPRRALLLAGMFWMVVSLSTVYWAVTRTVVFDRPSVISLELVFEIGWLFTTASGLFFIGVVVISILLWLVEWLAVRRNPKAPSSDSNKEPTAREELEASTGDEGWQYLGFHDLRRTWAMQLLGGDVDAMVVCNRGGWSDLETFLDHYRGTSTPEAQRRERAKVEGL